VSPESKATEKITGTVEAIYTTSSAGKPMQPLSEAEAIAGQGLAGDRYLKGTGYYSKRPLADGSREITLIETEELQGLERETGIHLDPSESRRNVLTRSVSLNGLIGKRFRMGKVVCEGIRICEPCTYLEKLTQKRVMRPLVHRGGLRARIISGGTVRVGDAIWDSSGDPLIR
jgi:MOSC domain-containing protein YiiM